MSKGLVFAVMGLLIVIAILVIVWVVKQPRDKAKQPASMTEEPKIDWDQTREISTVLVIYAAETGIDPVPASVPRYVAHDLRRHDPKGDVLLPDVAPYDSLLDKEDFLEQVDKDLVKHAASAGIVNELKKIRAWAEKLSGPFCYLLEPPQIAGDGTARAQALRALYPEDYK